MNLKIVDFDPRRHLKQVVEFQAESFTVNFPGFSADDKFRREHARKLRRATKDRNEGLYVIGDDDNRARGFLWVQVETNRAGEHVGYIRSLYVSPDIRRDGWGTKLVGRAESWCRQRGIRSLELMVSACNPIAVCFYEEAGFQTIRYRMQQRLDLTRCGE